MSRETACSCPRRMLFSTHVGKRRSFHPKRVPQRRATDSIGLVAISCGYPGPTSLRGGRSWAEVPADDRVPGAPAILKGIRTQGRSPSRRSSRSTSRCRQSRNNWRSCTAGHPVEPYRQKQGFYRCLLKKVPAVENLLDLLRQSLAHLLALALGGQPFLR